MSRYIGSVVRAQRCLRATAAVAVAISMMLAGLMMTQPRAQAANSVPTAQRGAKVNAHFMVYYRAWRDKTMKGVNTSLPDQNWITMHDIPYGVDVVNVFSYVPGGQEEQAKPFYDALKNEYAPELHARGVRLVRGVGYDELAKVPHAGPEPTQQEYDSYARHLVDSLITSIGVDGLDIDMESSPDANQVMLSSGVIRSLSKLLGPKANNATMLIYDTNGSNLAPLKDVSDCFDYLAYQQYGSNADRTARAVGDYSKLLQPSRFVPGLTFPEEQDMNNRWYDAAEPYRQSNMYAVATYVRQHNLGGMFIYALDRDGRTYDDSDLYHIKASSLMWTKTMIDEVSGMPLGESKALARHYLGRMKYAKAVGQTVLADVEKAASLYEVNKSILGPDYGASYNPNYDPMLERQLIGIDITRLTSAIDKADAYLSGAHGNSTVAALKKVTGSAVSTIAAKVYDQNQITVATNELQKALAAVQSHESKPSGPGNPDNSSSTGPTAGHSQSKQPNRLADTGTGALTMVVTALLLLVSGVVVRGLYRRRHAIHG